MQNPILQITGGTMKYTYLIILSLIISACSSSNMQNYNTDISELSLKELYADSFLIGAAINKGQIYQEDKQTAAIVTSQYNTLTAENEMKWEKIHPLENEYDFASTDKLVELSTNNKHFLVGHTLIWHFQTPDWVFEDSKGNPVSRELLLKRMRDHIQTIVSRYRGKVDAWDVVNEALNDDGTLRKSKWLDIIGPEYIAKAFEFAHAADPDAALYYNDYNLFDARKRQGTLEIVRSLKAQDLKIDGIGIQGHYGLDFDKLDEVEKSIIAFAEEGMQVMFTEVDISVLKFPETESQGADISIDVELQNELNPFAKKLPLSVTQQQADYYRNLFELFLKHRDSINRVTFWGLTDAHSWRNDWPMKGRTDYPLLFDRNNKPKQAFDAIVKLKKSFDNKKP